MPSDVQQPVGDEARVEADRDAFDLTDRLNDLANYLRGTAEGDVARAAHTALVRRAAATPPDAQREIDRLTAEVAALREGAAADARDAARYRWLLAQSNAEVAINDDIGEATWFSGKRLTAHIDEAIASEPTP